MRAVFIECREMDDQLIKATSLFIVNTNDDFFMSYDVSLSNTKKQSKTIIKQIKNKTVNRKYRELKHLQKFEFGRQHPKIPIKHILSNVHVILSNTKK